MKNKIAILLVISLLLILLSEITNYLLDYNKLIYDSLAEKLTSYQLEGVFDFKNKWQWVTYILITILLFFKSLLISSVLYISVFFKSKVNVEFKQILDVTIKAELVFVFIPIIKIIWFYFIQTNYSLEDIQYFFPLSALNIFDYKELESWLIYPLQTLNVFELAYIIILSYQLGTLTNTNADTGLKIVASSYLPALLLWVTVVMFFTLNFS